jgi:hypothetical protein
MMKFITATVRITKIELIQSGYPSPAENRTIKAIDTNAATICITAYRNTSIENGDRDMKTARLWARKFGGSNRKYERPAACDSFICRNLTINTTEAI